MANKYPCPHTMEINYPSPCLCRRSVAGLGSAYSNRENVRSGNAVELRFRTFIGTWKRHRFSANPAAIKGMDFPLPGEDGDRMRRLSLMKANRNGFSVLSGKR